MKIIIKINSSLRLRVIKERKSNKEHILRSMQKRVFLKNKKVNALNLKFL